MSNADTVKIATVFEQSEVRNGWLKERFDKILPEIMDREGFDMWIVSAREYNEDPVLLSLLPQPVMAARRRTILVFYRRPDVKGGPEAVERLAIDRSGIGQDFYRLAWPYEEPDQWQVLRKVVEERDPKSIGINVSETFALGDGLSHSEYTKLMETLGPKYSSRACSAERLSIGWLERRLPDEIHAYTGIVRICHKIVAEAFSNKVIHPGITTPSDVAWWMIQRIQALGLRAWFMPSVLAQRSGVEQVGLDEPILPGDRLHCDVGFEYFGLACDIQQNAYVLKLNEGGPPKGLQNALTTANRLQDIVIGEIAIGRTGNEILQESLKKASRAGIKACVYCHPIGYHGHGAGTAIGMWDRQEGIPGKGDYEIFDDTCHALELNIRQEVPEWGGQEIIMALEEDIVITDGKVFFLDGRQERFHMIR